MAPARKGTGTGEKAKERLTAVVLADSFTQKFRPVTSERAKVLLPLANTPMLDYTLEWLAINSIEEVFVFCCSHAEQVQDHLKQAGWLKSSRRMKVSTVVATNCLSIGDALRLLDHKDIIKTDFVLVFGDVVTNINLKDAMEAHARRRAADKAAIMTLVLRSGMTPAHRARLGDLGTTAVVDPKTLRLVKFEDGTPLFPSTSQNTSTTSSTATRGKHPMTLASPTAAPSSTTTTTTTRNMNTSRFRLDAHLFGERDDLVIRNDLLDVGIYLCAPEVLMIFSDNFDYQNVRKDFVSGVLSEEELGNKLFIHDANNAYAARVHTMRSYDAVTRDVLSRWVYPLVPDTNLFKKKKLVKHVEMPPLSFDTHHGGSGNITTTTSTTPSMLQSRNTESGQGVLSHMNSSSGYHMGGGGDHHHHELSPFAAVTSHPYPLTHHHHLPLAQSPDTHTHDYIYTQYSYERNKVYRDCSTRISRTSKVGSTCCIGSHTFLDEDVVVEETVIGQNCYIGAGTVLRGCYLGDNVVVGKNVRAFSGLFCDYVVVKDNALIMNNSILSYRVVIDRNTTVPPNSRISLTLPPSSSTAVADSDDELEMPVKASSSPSSSFSPRHAKQHHARTLQGKTKNSSNNNNNTKARAERSSTSIYSNSDDDETDDDDATDDEGNEDDANLSIYGPEKSILSAAIALATDGIPETTTHFSTEVVGPMGAGFLWPLPRVQEGMHALDVSERFGLVPPLESLISAGMLMLGCGSDGADADVDAMLGIGIHGGEKSHGDASDTADAITSTNPLQEPHFKTEVAETFLRCIKENILQENVVIELNGLKIAEDKTFADCARFMLTTALGLCLPPPPTIAKEYKGQYASTDIDCSSKEGQLELLKRASMQLRRWQELLRKFLRNEEDQVEVLLTFEEFCGQEGDFENTGERGAAFAAIFPQMLKVMYELDITSEEALLQWADEKEDAEEAEKVFLKKAEPFLEWLKDAEEESSGAEEESSDDE